MKRWGPLVVLAAAQFVMVLDQAVMNVSISQLVKDFDTSVTAIQAVITLYSLTMAMFMVAGGKIGDIIGRKRAFIVGLAIYGCGSLVTALSQSVWTLALGWSVLEGIGAALVLPALAALVAGNYADKSRLTAYSVIGGVAGAGIAVGPIVGGWATTALSWRVVFAGEVVLVLGILACIRLLRDAPNPGTKPKLDTLGAALSALGLGLIVLGVLQASTWGWIQPKHSPLTPFGFSLTPFVVGAGATLMYAFVKWQQYREARAKDPLVHLQLFSITPLRAGLQALLSQNLILMGIFFTIPLYLQLVLGLDALESGIRMLPASVAMFLAAIAGASLAERFSTRTIIRAGIIAAAVGSFFLLAYIDPQLNEGGFAISMALLGVGTGLMASQLGNVVQSSVDASGRSEAGGLQYTAQQLGSSLGVALIGAIVLSGLIGSFASRVENDPRISSTVKQQVSVSVSGNVSFVSADQVRTSAEQAGVPPAEVNVLVENYEESQLKALKAGLFAAGLIAIAALFFTKGLPSKKPERMPMAASQ
ncbi:MAG: MFS transporter [Acidimicrobiia bacterium]